MNQSIKPYYTYSDGKHSIEATFVQGDNGDTILSVDGNNITELPPDYVYSTIIHNDNLYIVYIRSILRVPNIAVNNKPDDEYTLEMQDYYSYEAPQLLSDNNGTLWAHIGGRLFRLVDTNTGKWEEKAQFYIGDQAEVYQSEILRFSKNLQYDDITTGWHEYNITTGKLSDTQ